MINSIIFKIHFTEMFDTDAYEMAERPKYFHNTAACERWGSEYESEQFSATCRTHIRATNQPIIRTYITANDLRLYILVFRYFVILSTRHRQLVSRARQPITKYMCGRKLFVRFISNRFINISYSRNATRCLAVTTFVGAGRKWTKHISSQYMHSIYDMYRYMKYQLLFDGCLRCPSPPTPLSPHSYYPIQSSITHTLVVSMLYARTQTGGCVWLWHTTRSDAWWCVVVVIWTVPIV